MNKNGNSNNYQSVNIDNELKLNIHYHIGQGGLWGSYDFWTGILENLTASIILIPLNVAIGILANKIHDTFKTSKAEKDNMQSCRFDLLIPVKNNSWIVVRLMRSAKFRSKIDLKEKDIYNAILSSIKKFNNVSKKNPNKTYLISAELTNHSDEIKLKTNSEVDIDVNSLPGIIAQIKQAKSGEPIILKYK